MSKAELTKSTLTPPPVLPLKAKARMTLIFFIVLGFYFFSSYKTEASIGEFIDGFGNMGELIQKFFPPNLGLFQAIWPALAETIQMAVIATTISAILCIPLSLLAANNVTTNKYVYQFVRLMLNILRTIPDLVLAVLFVAIFGIGALPGIIALIIFSLGILAKLISETIEAIDMNPLQAMQASGANTIQTISFSVVPQVLPQFTSFVLYVFEINIRASVVLGLVGAGGIGQILDQQIKFYKYPNAMGIIIIIFALVVIIEYISSKIREAII
ncbi:alkylphosphonate ABC transporter permease [Bacillus coahuilensis m2-6]|uniref:phosphonate ABC transporter, permease protein PhnE n=1 Tax=Bacillus coahuilensis TaxID=408580 RepID=UPI00075055D2|nr:phosphonate ABC transporter, permease protein PhnE [Bacillus coahuilensis]KUP05398.1 alkylphosphonate ABC transporter permease [Bacillus coahuilensis m2-6]